MDTDHILIKRMRRGDEDAFEMFIHKYYNDIFRYCTYHCCDSEEAKDLTQDTFLRFFSKFSDYKHKGKTKNYLYTIAANLCKSHYKKVMGNLIDPIEIEILQNPVEDDHSMKMTVRMCIDQLQEEFREVIILYYYQDLKQSEIADILEIGLPLVKYRLKTAKKQIEKFLTMEE